MNHQNLTLPFNFLQEFPNMENSILMKGIKKETSRCEQMTIFYDGKVIVFDEISAEKAKEITMSFSTKSQNQINNYAHPLFLANNSVQEHRQVPSTPVIYDLPMTRKASLCRFLEKRKNRIAARAPYQTTNQAATFNNKSIDESMSWLSLAPQSPQHKSECSSTSVLF